MLRASQWPHYHKVTELAPNLGHLTPRSHCCLNYIYFQLTHAFVYYIQHIPLFKMALQTGTMARASSSSAWEVSVEGQEFKGSLGYIESLREALGT